MRFELGLQIGVGRLGQLLNNQLYGLIVVPVLNVNLRQLHLRVPVLGLCPVDGLQQLARLLDAPGPPLAMPQLQRGKGPHFLLLTLF